MNKQKNNHLRNNESPTRPKLRDLAVLGDKCARSSVHDDVRVGRMAGDLLHQIVKAPCDAGSARDHLFRRSFYHRWQRLYGSYYYN
jgi:hypothetical protein